MSMIKIKIISKNLVERKIGDGELKKKLVLACYYQHPKEDREALIEISVRDPEEIAKFNLPLNEEVWVLGTVYFMDYRYNLKINDYKRIFEVKEIKPKN